MKEETTYHIPVLLMPSVDAMNIRPDGTYVDVTFGGGGHSREILPPGRRRPAAELRPGRGCGTQHCEQPAF